MLDIKLIRTQPEIVKAALARRKMDIDIDLLLDYDKQKREIMYSTEQLKAQQNEVSKKIPVMKKNGEDVAPIFAEMKEISETAISHISPKSSSVKNLALSPSRFTTLLSATRDLSSWSCPMSTA